MSLDARVYCDCFEKGRIRTPPPHPDLVFVDDSGLLCLDSSDPEAAWGAFYEWMENACEHGPIGHILWHRLGNIARIAFLRSRFSEYAEQFPVLLEKVVYNGVHGGDFLTLTDVERVAVELESLKDVHADDEADEAIIREFEVQMRELVEASRRTGKPIAF